MDKQTLYNFLALFLNKKMYEEKHIAYSTFQQVEDILLKRNEEKGYGSLEG